MMIDSCGVAAHTFLSLGKVQLFREGRTQPELREEAVYFKVTRVCACC